MFSSDPVDSWNELRSVNLLIQVLGNDAVNHDDVAVKMRQICEKLVTASLKPIHDTLARYGVAILPLIDILEDQFLTHNWYADDGNVAASLQSLRTVLDNLNEPGGAFVYNVIRGHLFAKQEFLQEANISFLGLDDNDIDSHRVLGSIIGSDKNCNNFMNEKSNKYYSNLNRFAKLTPNSDSLLTEPKT